MRFSYLFSATTFADYAESIRRKSGSKIERLTERHFLLKAVDAVAEDIFHEFSLKIPVILIDDVFQRKPVDVRIEMEPEYDGRHSQKIDGTRFEIILPFTGSADLFSVRPTIYDSDPPYGEIEPDGIHFIYQIQVFQDQNSVRENFDQNFKNIKLWLDNLIKDINRFNNSLRADILTAVNYRRKKVAKDAEAANLLGFPIK
jgi:hypothetical protein